MCVEYISPFFYFQLVCVFVSQVSLVDSIQLDPLCLPVRPMSVFRLENIILLNIKGLLTRRMVFSDYATGFLHASELF